MEDCTLDFLPFLTNDDSFQLIHCGKGVDAGICDVLSMKARFFSAFSFLLVLLEALEIVVDTL